MCCGYYERPNRFESAHLHTAAFENGSVLARHLGRPDEWRKRRKNQFHKWKKIISKTKMRIYLNFKTNVAFLSASDVLESPTLMN